MQLPDCSVKSKGNKKKQTYPKSNNPLLLLLPIENTKAFATLIFSSMLKCWDQGPQITSTHRIQPDRVYHMNTIWKKIKGKYPSIYLMTRGNLPGPANIATARGQSPPLGQEGRDSRRKPERAPTARLEPSLAQPWHLRSQFDLITHWVPSAPSAKCEGVRKQLWAVPEGAGSEGLVMTKMPGQVSSGPFTAAVQVEATSLIPAHGQLGQAISTTSCPFTKLPAEPLLCCL